MSQIKVGMSQNMLIYNDFELRMWQRFIIYLKRNIFLMRIYNSYEHGSIPILRLNLWLICLFKSVAASPGSSWELFELLLRIWLSVEILPASLFEDNLSFGKVERFSTDTLLGFITNADKVTLCTLLEMLLRKLFFLDDVFEVLSIMEEKQLNYNIRIIKICE